MKPSQPVLGICIEVPPPNCPNTPTRVLLMLTPVSGTFPLLKAKQLQTALDVAFPSNSSQTLAATNGCQLKPAAVTVVPTRTPARPMRLSIGLVVRVTPSPGGVGPRPNSVNENAFRCEKTRPADGSTKEFPMSKRYPTSPMML